MGRLLKVCLFAAFAALGGLVARRLLGLEEEMSAPVAGPTTGVNESDATRDELYREAKELKVEGRSKMNKGQLQEAVEAAKTGGRT